MNYVRGIGSSVSTAWNSINPATLSGAIDVIVVEQEDGSLACSPFHVRFGKFSLLRPSEKKVEFTINGEKQEYPMKLGDGGEAFFVFETKESIPEALQTSPLVSPATSPEMRPSAVNTPALQEPDPFELEGDTVVEPSVSTGGMDLSATSGGRLTATSGGRLHVRSTTEGMPIPSLHKAKSEGGEITPLSAVPDQTRRPNLGGDLADLGQARLAPRLERNATEGDLQYAKAAIAQSFNRAQVVGTAAPPRSISPPKARTDRSGSPPAWSKDEAVTRAIALSKKLWTSNIATQVTDSGDLMLDMTGYKSDTSEALQAEGIARRLLSEELEGPYDIGALIGADEKGNLWIYSSEEAKQAAAKKAAADGLGALQAGFQSADALSDPGYHSDDARSDSTGEYAGTHYRRDSDSAVGLMSHPSSPTPATAAGDPNRNYAKTLRLTSDQLKAMDLKSGGNQMSFSVNRATCGATLWYWKHDVPIVISDIDGTITKSDVLGHVLTSIGRDWTHQGVAKLYTEISANGYNFLYLTSRSVGQADRTRGYIDGVVQDGYKLPKGPIILSPDQTIAALRREVYLRKPEVFKMACLRDIMNLFAGHGGTNDTTASAAQGLSQLPAGMAPGRGKGGSPFYAGFGNRLTDALSYRSVNIPSTRIFTINSNSEVSLDLLSLNKYKTGYASMREIVDHYFPPIGLRLLVEGGAEDFTDFNYWRTKPLDLVDFTDSESDSGDVDEDLPTGMNSLDLDRTRTNRTAESIMSGSAILSEDEAGSEMLDSYLSEAGRPSMDDSIYESIEEGDEDDLTASMLEDEEYEGDEEQEDVSGRVTPPRDTSAERRMGGNTPRRSAGA
jgi:phosphatidate phosphatase LPIN